MSSYGLREYTCAVCGLTHEYNVLMSTNTFGGTMDLDTRPPEMQRSTMHSWVHMCPACGYVANSVSDETTVNQVYLNSFEYKYCNGNNFDSMLAERFYKKYLISLKDEKYEAAFHDSLHAAWASDDSNDIENARMCRRQCIDLIPKIESKNDKSYAVIKADLLRRIGCFEEVIDEYKDMVFEEEILQKIIKFEIKKAKEKDSKCYRVGDV